MTADSKAAGASTTATAAAARPPLRLGIYGYGEVGHGTALGFIKAGAGTVHAYQRVPVRDSIRALAEGAGTVLVDTPLELARRCDVIIACTQGSKAADAARAIAPALRADHLYMDLSSATPSIKRAIAAALAPSGALFADAAMEGSPLVHLHAYGTLVSGPGAQACVDRLNPWGMRIAVVGSEVGQAAAIKGLRHILTKGQIGLAIECGLAARRLGIGAEVFQSVTEWYDAMSWLENVSRLTRTTAVHAGRRFEEACMAVQIMKELGIDPVMTPATV